MTLHEKITARIDELERDARACLTEAPGDWRADHHSEVDFVVEAWDEGPDTSIMVTGSLADARFIATWDPDTVLRGLAEDRDILARHQPAPNVPTVGEPWCAECRRYGCREIRSLARRHGIEAQP